LKYGILFILFVIASRLQGQDFLVPQVQGSITTDSIDLFSNSRVERKSNKAALAASLLLPGSGHQYLGRNTSALGYISADVAAVFGFFFCTHFANKLAQDAAGFAWIHSGAQGAIKDADDYYWKLVGNFMDVQEYNEVIDLNRDSPDKKIIDQSRAWRWDDESSQKRFNELRTFSRRYRITASFFLGALVLDRVIAFIELRTFTRSSSIKRGKLGALHINPSFTYSANAFQCSLSGAF
jgi:hypothetical protein